MKNCCRFCASEFLKFCHSCSPQAPFGAIFSKGPYGTSKMAQFHPKSPSFLSNIARFWRSSRNGKYIKIEGILKIFGQKDSSPPLQNYLAPASHLTNENQIEIAAPPPLNKLFVGNFKIDLRRWLGYIKEKCEILILFANLWVCEGAKIGKLEEHFM